MENLVLIVDDDVMNIKAIQDILRDEYRVATAVSGPLALRILDRTVPALILLDANMPDMSGFEFAAELKKRNGTLPCPIIFMSGEGGSAVEGRALEAGAEDYITRPFTPALLKLRVRHTLERCEYCRHLEEMARAQAGSIVRRTMRTGEIQQGMIIAMASLIESRDGSTGEHIRRAEKYMEILAEAVQREGYHRETVTDDYVDALCRAAYIHDIGKLCVSDAILQKQGGLTDEEFEQMKYHTTAGGEMIRSAMGIFRMRTMCRSPLTLRPIITSVGTEADIRRDLRENRSRFQPESWRWSTFSMCFRPAAVTSRRFRCSRPLKSWESLQASSSIRHLRRSFSGIKMSSPGLQEASAVREAMKMSENANKKRLLIVDDDKMVLSILRGYLLTEYNVRCVDSGKEALEILEYAKPDCILLDYKMPVMDGPEVLKRIRQLGKATDVPVIFLTGASDRESVAECLSYHPADYILKPVDKNTLLRRLKNVLQ